MFFDFCTFLYLVNTQHRSSELVFVCLRTMWVVLRLATKSIRIPGYKVMDRMHSKVKLIELKMTVIEVAVKLAVDIWQSNSNINIKVTLINIRVTVADVIVTMM